MHMHTCTRLPTPASLSSAGRPGYCQHRAGLPRGRPAGAARGGPPIPAAHRLQRAGGDAGARHVRVGACCAWICFAASLPPCAAPHPPHARVWGPRRPAPSPCLAVVHVPAPAPAPAAARSGTRSRPTPRPTPRPGSYFISVTAWSRRPTVSGLEYGPVRQLGMGLSGSHTVDRGMRSTSPMSAPLQAPVPRRVVAPPPAMSPWLSMYPTCRLVRLPGQAGPGRGRLPRAAAPGAAPSWRPRAAAAVACALAGRAAGGHAMAIAWHGHGMPCHAAPCRAMARRGMAMPSRARGQPRPTPPTPTPPPSSAPPPQLIEPPQPIMMHDCAITQNHMLLLDVPLVFDPKVGRASGSRSACMLYYMHACYAVPIKKVKKHRTSTLKRLLPKPQPPPTPPPSPPATAGHGEGGQAAVCV